MIRNLLCNPYNRSFSNNCFGRIHRKRWLSFIRYTWKWKTSFLSLKKLIWAPEKLRFTPFQALSPMCISFYIHINILGSICAPCNFPRVIWWILGWCQTWKLEYRLYAAYVSIYNYRNISWRVEKKHSAAKFSILYISASMHQIF